MRGEMGVKRIILPHPTRRDVERNIAREFPDALQNDTELKTLTEVFNAYFKGGRVPANIPIDWSGNTEFSIKVWSAAQSIPWGEVRTYKWLSLYLRRPQAFRAVGNLLGKNPFPIVVPCHRVVRNDGTLGGFSAPEGVVLKRIMLEREGVRFGKNGRVVLKPKNWMLQHAR